MNRRLRRNIEKKGEGEGKINVIFAGVIIVIAVAAFISAYVLYENKMANKLPKKTDIEKIASENIMSNMINNSESSTVSSSMGKTVNEIKSSGNDTNNKIESNKKPETEKRAVNTNETEKKVVAERTTTKKTKTDTKKEDKTNENIQQDPKFIKPVDGDIIKDYSKDNLIYSNTLQEWTTHLGIDYAAEKTSIVKAAAEGTIKSIKNDPRYGLILVIEHNNGFTSTYANLLSTEFVKVGEKVTEGQTIGTVGNTAIFEIADETHLHFEIQKDGVNIDPNLYMK